MSSAPETTLTKSSKTSLPAPKTPLLKIGLHFNVDRKIYDADPGLNQSKLKALLEAKSPAHFRHDQDHPDADKKAFRLGNAIDLLCNEPHKFGSQFVLWEGERRQGNVWKEFTEKNKDKTILTTPELEQVKGMVSGLERNEDAHAVITNSYKQVCVIANHMSGVRMKCLLDFMPEIHESSDCLFDLKSTNRGADEETFFKSAYDFGYHIQAAYYMDACRAVGVMVNRFAFIVIENFPPFECKIHYLKLHQDETELGRKQYQKAMIEYQSHVNAGKWPGYSSSWSNVTFTKWQLEGRKREFETLS
jgi:hypothetical protein